MNKHTYLGLLVFWGITTIMIILLVYSGYWIIPYMSDMWEEDPVWVTITALAILLFVGLYVALGVFVYKDSSRKQMNTWLWMTAVFYIPNFMGVVLYLFARKRQRVQNASGMHAQYCPHCGQIIYQGSEFK
ncbi:hypothetical protein [Paenibacillus sp. sgz5001063]|uniref:hypothetical protein n=1 Tax=Paenibacillus sp. sgz5001063 TaxID=3242474 RepID=UPI0036D2978C